MTWVFLSQPPRTRETIKSHGCSKEEALIPHLPLCAKRSGLREKVPEASQPTDLVTRGLQGPSCLQCELSDPGLAGLTCA